MKPLNQLLSVRNQWTPIKQDADSAVFHAMLSDGIDVIIKQVQLPTSLKRLRFSQKVKRLRCLQRDMSGKVNLATLIDNDCINGAGYLVYEIVPGQDFRQVKFSELTPDQIEAIGVQVADNLVQLHRGGWIHGDLKFGNVMLSSAGNIVFVDMESSRRPLFAKSAEARDVARFILNCLERKVPPKLWQAFWNQYQIAQPSAQDETFKNLVQAWVRKLYLRHQRKTKSPATINLPLPL